MSHFVMGVLVPKYIAIDDDGAFAENWIQSYVAEILAPYNEADDEYCVAEEQNEDADDPDDKYRYNPNGKWDWWVVGGRWDGYLQKSVSNHDGYSPERETIGGNIIPVSEHIRDVMLDFNRFKCFGLVSEDGWFETGAMGWFGMVSNRAADDPLFLRYVTVLNNYSDGYIVAIDCHV